VDCFRRAFWALMAPFLLIGGMLSGVFTPTEAAAVAVVYALILGCSSIASSRCATCRGDPRHRRNVRRGDGAGDDGVAAGYCITVARIPQEFGGWLTSLTTNPLVYLLIVNVLLLVVGCFMEALAAMLVLIPSWCRRQSRWDRPDSVRLDTSC
jgi:TRAP-type C4-dicarboxylate transport system permease large subunit